jgi:hypothetical protein
MNAYFELGPDESDQDINRYRKVPVWCPFQRCWITTQRTNLKDLREFEEALDREKAPDDDGYVVFSTPPNVFRTYYSIGFCRATVQPDDMIFAVDGVRAPLILRKQNGASSGYRVVGDCYLWAALELDYWNPGTWKGLWRSRPYDLGKVQTQMIEIY